MYNKGNIKEQAEKIINVFLRILVFLYPIIAIILTVIILIKNSNLDYKIFGGFFMVWGAIYCIKYWLNNGELQYNKVIRVITIILIFFIIGMSWLLFYNCSFLLSSSDSIELIKMYQDVSPGENEYIMIKGEPNTEYDISVQYASGYSSASGLYTKETNNDGYVWWDWKVGTNTSSGKYPITITNMNTQYEEFFYFTVE